MKARVLALGWSLAVVFAIPAFAADMPVKAPVYQPPPMPAWTWTGWYIGATAGGTWSNDPVTSRFTCPATVGCAYAIPSDLAAGSAFGTGSLGRSGFTGGAEIGYNWQIGGLVLGGETDFESFSAGRSQTVTGKFPAAVTSPTEVTSVKTNWLYTLRARAGWAIFPNALLYATGGLALTQARISNAFNDNFVSIGGAANTVGASSASSTWSGYVVGGGLEWALAQNWTVKGEYLYVNFGGRSTNAVVAGFPGLAPNALATTGTLSANIARAGLNYKF
jgi:outer membrane immunogenic protein